MSTSSHPRVTPTAAPRPRTAPGRPPPETDPLAAAVDAGLERLRDLSAAEHPSPSGDIEHRSTTGDTGSTAVIGDTSP